MIQNLANCNSQDSQIDIIQLRSQEYQAVFIDGERKIGGTKIKFLLKITKNQEVKYISADGSILRIDQIKDQQKTYDILKNLKQISYLHWQGEYGKQSQKKGNWTVNWNGETLIDVGGLYSNEGKKEGIWKELNKNYWDYSQVYEAGQYSNDERTGVWKFLYLDQHIGGGLYDQFLKKGKWIELTDGFYNNNQVIYQGEYLNGNKFGIWDIYLKENGRWKFIGGGLYDKSGLKNGKWLELNEGFDLVNQVILFGEYESGKKIGMWNISYYGQQIVCGSYNDQGQKEGQWVDIKDDKYNYITFHGNYIKNNKLGLWEIKFDGEQIGGGTYDENGSKIGRWVDLYAGFSNDSQVIYSGVYENGKKTGRWDIVHREQKSYQWKLIGGGTYEESGVKCGKWVDLFTGFSIYSQITENGEYIHGKKVGRWDINQNLTKIGGGIYDKQGFKNEQWIDLIDDFDNDRNVIFVGEYYHGKKIGRWDIKIEGKQTGGGSYGENCLKNEKWVELSDNYRYENEVIYKGEYLNGKKIDRWDIFYRKELIGGGTYNQQHLKNGKWVELSQGFDYENIIVNEGEYKNGKKVGRWEIKYKYQQDKPWKQIGGGEYNQSGLKDGKWADLITNEINDITAYIYEGSYQNGKKLGFWDKYNRKYDTHELINYDK